MTSLLFRVVLIVDVASGGLVPIGRDEIFGQLKSLHANEKITVIIVSHSMEDMAKVASRLIVMNKGMIVLDGTPKIVFKQIDLLEEIGLAVPQISYLIRALNTAGFSMDETINTVEEAKDALIQILNKRIG